MQRVLNPLLSKNPLTDPCRYVKLRLQGVTVVFSSGDTGVPGRPTAEQYPGACLGPDNQIFGPTFPVKYSHFATLPITDLQLLIFA